MKEKLEAINTLSWIWRNLTWMNFDNCNFLIWRLKIIRKDILFFVHTNNICLFYKISKVIFHWISDRRTLPLDRRHHVFHNGTLLINKVARKDSGMYSCTATGRQGTSSTQSGHLKVIGKLHVDQLLIYLFIWREI